MTPLVRPAYPTAPARHHVLTFGKYRNVWLSMVPGVYLHFLLKSPSLDPDLRWIIFQTLQQSSDRRYAVDAVVFKAVVQVNGSIPSPRGRTRKER
jgi:hypothetical protein